MVGNALAETNVSVFPSRTHREPGRSRFVWRPGTPGTGALRFSSPSATSSTTMAFVGFRRPSRGIRPTRDQDRYGLAGGRGLGAFSSLSLSSSSPVIRPPWTARRRRGIATAPDKSLKAIRRIKWTRIGRALFPPIACNGHIITGTRVVSTGANVGGRKRVDLDGYPARGLDPSMARWFTHTGSWTCTGGLPVEP